MARPANLRSSRPRPGPPRVTGAGSRWRPVAGRIRAARRDESGAALILALVFVIVGALSLGGLLTFAGSALLDTANLKSARALDYAADGATDIAIQAVRYTPDAYQKPTGRPLTPPQNCLGPSSVQIDGYLVAVDCSGSIGSLPTYGEATFASGSPTISSPATTDLFSGNATFVGYEVQATAVPVTPPTTIVSETNSAHTATMSAPATLKAKTALETITLFPPRERVVSFYACVATRGTCTSANSLLHAVVDFNDVSSSGSYACSSTSTTTCGTSLVVKQWVVTRASS
jgi:hypothetical protein